MLQAVKIMLEAYRGKALHGWKMEILMVGTYQEGHCCFSKASNGAFPTEIMKKKSNYGSTFRQALKHFQCKLKLFFYSCGLN